MLPVRSVRAAARRVPRAEVARKTPAQLRFRQAEARFQSTHSSASSGSAGTSPLVAGLVGGLAAGGLLYGAYYVSPAGRTARTINKTYKEAAHKYQEAAAKLQQATPNSKQAIGALKQYCHSYAGWVPGGRQFVDGVFRDIDTVCENHGDEADKLVGQAYAQLQDAAKSGLSLEAANKGFEVLADLGRKMADLAGDAAGDVLDNHPDVKKQLGGSVDQLKRMGEQYGPEAKKQVDETWRQAKRIFEGGMSVDKINKARKLIEDKVEQVKALGEEAWKKALEEAKPLLDKNPKVKELLEKNGELLKRGDAKDVFDRARKAMESGDMGGLEDYVKQAVDKAKSQGSQVADSLGLDQYFQMLPDGGDMLPKLKQLQEVAQKHTKEGEQLLKETVEELKRVLESKSQKAQEVLEQAKKEAK